MPVRDIIQIDEDLCTGCGDCIIACAEGAIRLVDGKARLVSDSYCDGLGACLGHCPEGAITMVRRLASDFDDEAVALRRDEQSPTMERAPTVLPMAGHGGVGCPGSRVQQFARFEPPASRPGEGSAPSRLRQWPVQLHLLPPVAPFLEDADLLLAADCSGYAVGGFHDRFLAGHALAIACPKLDSRQDLYLEKLTAMIDQAGLRSITVAVMEVPCCSGLVQLVQEAAARAAHEVPIRVLVITVRGDVLAERAVSSS